MVSSDKWHILVLAASRGPDDPMAKAFGVKNKCMIEIAGKPMLVRVVETLLSYKSAGPVGVVIENMETFANVLGEDVDHVHFYQSESSAPASVLTALELIGDNEAVLVTTADHDDRVVPAHSFKFIAELQDKYKGDNPVLIRIETKSGHGSVSTTKMIQEMADEFAFMFYNMGVMID